MKNNLIEWWQVESLYYNTPELMAIIKRQVRLEDMRGEGRPSAEIAAFESALNKDIEVYNGRIQRGQEK